MISFLVTDFNNISQESYDTAVSAIDLHQLKCPACGHSGCLAWHAIYERRVSGPKNEFMLKVQRVICSCGKTHALLPASLVPYSKFILRFHVFIAMNGSGDRAVAQLQLAGAGIDPRTARYIFSRFIRYWKQRLLSFDIPLCSFPDLVRGCMEHYSRQFMQIKRGWNILFSPPT